MEDGFIPDFTTDGYAHAYWYPGKPESGWLTGIWVEKEKKLSIKAFRCTGCGFLDLFAKSARDTALPN